MVSEETQHSKKIKEQKCSENLSFYFTEYCDNTSIHGLKFLGERKRSIIEKIWWLIFVGVSLYFCIVLIMKTYNKWINAPVLVSFATSETHIWKIPFPAVTICPLTKTERSKLDMDDVASRTDVDFEDLEMQYISMVCPKIQNKILTEQNYTTEYDRVSDDVNDFLISVSPNLTKLISSYKWLGQKRVVSYDSFTPLLTSGGVCFSFNMLDRDDIYTKQTFFSFYVNHQPHSEWTLDGGFPEDSELDTFPRRTFLTGTNGGLELTLSTTGEDLTQNCSDLYQGYKIILHKPGELPRYHQRYFWVSFNEVVSASVIPKMMTTSTELKDYDPLDRKCYFTNEKNLKYFQTYNQQNCIFECLSNFTCKKCGCVGFYMARDSRIPICGPAKLSCVEKANIEFISRGATLNDKRKFFKAGRKIECNCLPSCHSLQYDVETSQLKWNWKKDTFNANTENQTVHFSRLRIFFKNLQFMTSERNELYGQAEFWANCGGLIGLFTGFSFISLVEVLYFVTLRLFCNVKRHGWNNWSGAEELIEVRTDKQTE